MNTQQVSRTCVSAAPFEDSIHIQQDGRDSESPYLLVKCTVPHLNGRNYSVTFLCRPTSHTHAITGEELKIWGIEFRGASFKDAKFRRRFVSERHQNLRHELAFIPSQLVRAHLEKNGYFKLGETA